jgi:hypothetical protein
VDNGNFKTFFAGAGDNSILGATNKIETDFDGISKKFVDKNKIGTTQTGEISGVTWAGTYIDSTQSDYYNSDTDNYFTEINNKKVTFSINRETGGVSKFFIAENLVVIDKKLTRDECYVKALEHMKLYISDIENYEFIREEKRVEGFGYNFVFGRIVNGFNTSETVSVSIRENGDIYSHVLHSINSMKNIDISKIGTNKIYDAVGEKIKNIYSKFSDIKYTVDTVTLSKRADGKYILEYRVNVSVTDIDKGNEYADYCLIIVEII